jgi:hypothetical protein
MTGKAPPPVENLSVRTNLQPPPAPAKAPAPPKSPSFSASACVKLLAEKKHAELAKHFADTLDQLAKVPLLESNMDVRLFANVFVQTLAFCLCQQDMTIEDGETAIRLIRHGETISHLAAISTFGNTDFALDILLRMPRNYIKMLILYSPRNRIRIEPAKLFDAHSEAASAWYFAFVGNDFGKIAEAEALDSLRKHFDAIDERLIGITPEMHHAYFSVTYSAPKAEEKVKRAVNNIVRHRFGARLHGFYDPAKVDEKHIMLASGLWFSSHSVYRTNYKFVEALKAGHRLTFVSLSKQTKPETGLFDDVIQLENEFDIEKLRGQHPVLIFYPDVGMTMGSIILANTRIAPVQIMSCGHPVSTFGSEIDFFLSGKDVEDKESAKRFYSERLILIPGRGVVANKLPHARKFPERPNSPVRIAVPWSAQKANHEMLLALKAVVERAKRPVEFHFTASTGLRTLGRAPFVATLKALLGEKRVIAHPSMPQERYLEWLSHMHLAIDSHPFGGFNTVVDGLFAGIPVLGFEGKRAFARYGPHLLRSLGLGGLAVDSVEKYINLMVRLIDDETLRQRWEAKIRKIDLESTVFAEENAAYFRQAVDIILADREAIMSDPERKPVVV